jgi:CubicO group peptidase (beta-lactamase class C family)
MRPSPLLRLAAGFCTLLGLPFAPLAAQSAAATAATPRRSAASELVALTDRVFAAWNNTHGPGCAVGIARGGETLLERGYGMADLAGNRPITPATILESGSVAKQFTATAILLLAADGKLALDDDARRYLPELPNYGRTITVRHLLTHTSGLREWSNLVAWQGWERGTRVHTNPDMVRLIAAQQTLNYPVGDHYSYTNSGFLLLHAIVERVSGQSFARFTRERIFVPLGMTNTSWRDDYLRVVPGLAQAYSRQGDGWRLNMPNDNVVGAGGLLTTVGDWLRWNRALTNRTLGAVSDSLVRRMTLTNGLTIEYALGLMVGQYRGTQQLAHSGSTAGYSTYLARYPALNDLSIAVMCNAAGANATGYTRAIVDALAPTLAANAAPDTVRTDHAALLAWRGSYEDRRDHNLMRLDTAGGLLRSGTTPVRTLRDGSYLLGATRVRLAQSSTGERTIRFATSDGDSVVATWRAADSWRPTATELAALAGRYQSTEIGNTLTVRVVNGALVVAPRDGLEFPLTPTVRDAFESPSGAVWFTRDNKGRVTTLHVGEGRAWDIHFTRLTEKR